VNATYSRLAPSAEATVDAANRCVEYTISNEEQGRDGHVILASAWADTENFMANPVFLWQHMDEIPPIGRVFGLHTVGRVLIGGVRYATTDFANTIFELVRDGFLQAVSTSWRPLAYDPMPNGGLRFTKVDLLEVSQVCVPALPTALATARSRGLNLRPLAEWASSALDGGRCSVPRGELEAICRAAAPGSTFSLAARDSGRAQRAAIAAELKAKGERQNLAVRLKARSCSKLPEASRSALVKVQQHHAKCHELQGELSRRHSRIDRDVEALDDLCKRLKRAVGKGDNSALTTVAADIQERASGIREDHFGSSSAAEDLGTSLGLASGLVNDIADGVPEM
jgi:hypothetical protein